MNAHFSVTDAPPIGGGRLDPSLREYLDKCNDSLTRALRPVSIYDIGALSAQSEQPILFDNVREYPGFRICDMLVRNRKSHGRALGVSAQEFLPLLAFRLRQPPRPLVSVADGPVKEIKWLGKDADLSRLPIPYHKARDRYPYLTAMILLCDPETGFYNTSHAGTTVLDKQRGVSSFVTPHSLRIMRKYRDTGKSQMPIVFACGLPPAYEIVGNFSGLHMDSWGELEMVGTVMDQDIPMVDCESINLSAPANAEIVIEGNIDLERTSEAGDVTSPSMYYLPHHEKIPVFQVTAITMRADRPIYRNHQTCPATDHQILPRLCHEAILYNRLREMGLNVSDVRFPSWGGALSCILQFEYPWNGFVNDALMMAMGAPWLNTKLVVAISPDTNIEDPAEVYHAIATRVDPARDVIIVPNTRGSLYDPSASPLEAAYPFRSVGKMGIDATIKSRYNKADFERAWPINWGTVLLKDYL